MKTMLFYPSFFIVGFIAGWNQLATADNVAKPGPSIERPARKPVPNLTLQVYIPRCEDLANPYSLADGKSCETLDTLEKKIKKKIEFKRTTHFRNGQEFIGWTTGSADANTKIKNLQILDGNRDTNGMSLEVAKKYCANRGAKVASNEEIGELINAGFLKIVRKAKNFNGMGFDKVHIMTSSGTDNQKIIGWNLEDPPQSKPLDPNKSSWNAKDGYNFSYCVVDLKK